MIPVYQEADQTAYDTLIESGMEINELSAEDMLPCVRSLSPVYDMVRSEIGDELWMPWFLSSSKWAGEYNGYT